MKSEAPWSIQLFGGLRIAGPDIEIDRFPTRRSALLLSRIALSRSGSVGRDDLAGALWPDDYLDATRLRLRQELNRLRETLGSAADFLTSDRSWIKLDMSKVIVDAREFNRLLNNAKAEGDPEVSSELRSKALALYLGPLLPEQTEDWVQAERHEFHSKHLSALIEHTEELMGRGQAQEALASALKAVRSDPYHEPARVAAMKAFSELGDVGGALRQFVEYEKALVREFSAHPSDAMQQLVAELRVKGESAPTIEKAEAPPPPEPIPNFAPLPAYLDSLVGRKEELSLLDGWLNSPSPTRLSTITGPGGVGKTRVAVAAAMAASDAFNNNVVFVGLADIEHGQKVIRKVQEEFRISGSSSTSEPLQGWGKKPCLLVLDNAEHVLDEAQRAVKEMLLAHPGICVLVTSRQKLGLGGEQEIPLSPLDVPDIAGEDADLETSGAAQLFLARARSVRPGYTIPHEQLEAFVLLLERLDGLPLAIELAAARIAFLSPEQMLGEIDDRFTFLVSRRADIGARHRSLRATIDWSFRGLDEDLKDTLCLLAAFRGGCTMELAKKVTGRADIVDLLQDLVEHSLIYRDEVHLGIRFRMLDSIRHYISEEMSRDQIAAARQTHAEVIASHLLPASLKLLGPEQNHWFDVIREEMDNARAAIEWSAEHDPALAARLGVSLWRFWCARGSPAEGAFFLDKILAQEPNEITRDWAETRLGRGIVAGIASNDTDACLWMSRAVEAFQSLNLPREVRWAQMNLAFALLEECRIHEALAVAQHALDGADANDEIVPLLGNVMARVLPRLGRTEEAMKLAEEAFAAVLKANLPAEVGRAYQSLAVVYIECGRKEGVRGLLLESLERLRPAPVQNFLCNTLICLAEQEMLAENWAAYDEYVREAKEIIDRVRDQKSNLYFNSFEARRLAKSGRGVEAIRRYEDALRVAGNRGGLRSSMQLIRMLAADAAEAGFVDDARNILKAELTLRNHLQFGLTPYEAIEIETALAILGPVEEASNLASYEDLVAKVLAITAGIR